MKKSNRIVIIICVLTFLFSGLSYALLPDSVQIMHSSVANATTYIPKLWAILLAALLSITGAAGILLSKEDEQGQEKYKTFVISVIGLVLFVYMLLVNCVFI